MAKTRIIKLSDLHVNTENYRFEPVGSQKEAIDQMVEDQDDKLFSLAEHIIESGFNPNDRVQVAVSNHDNTKYNVLEGNRRIVALKIAYNPDLLDNPKFSNLKKKFRRLHEENKGKLIKEVECTLYDNPAEADKWIKLKHGGQGTGSGTVGWNSQQIQRFDEKVEGKSSAALQIVKTMNSSKIVPTDIKSKLKDLKITNLNRLISDPDVRDMLGIEINNGIVKSEVEEKEVIKGLIHMFQDLLDPKFKVQKIYTKEDRKDYINKFPKTSKPDLAAKSKKPWQFNGSSGAVSSSTLKAKSSGRAIPKTRDVLIPKSFVLKIKNPKVNAIYHELQKLSVTNYANAVAVSFRVFIELTLDCYIEANNPPQVNVNSSLLTKITEIATDLEKKNIADKYICKGVRSAANNKNDLLGIETWNAYVHNANFSPTGQNLIITWDNIQSFIEKVWENIV
ncbi:hypothetical protein CH379_016335 [Leptospira ellisii]|uniref:ParB/Sulfiredoxin domain-containing protein n=3 Tax=Leptospira ellisii TaxID=2023197 RepID=A0AAE4U1F5_9LEPT|nr:hypothetical protein [Leptospira ellisii]MDV6237202.1 hypothetical protein [Leptospira ellisii]